MSDRTDEQLIADYLAGDTAALDLLFERYRRPFYSYFNRLLSGDATTADDIFQETWLRIIRALPSFNPSGSFSAWAFRIAHNQAMQSFRRSKTRSKVGALTADGELPEPAESSFISPDRLLNCKHLAQEIERALAKLSPEQREVFTLRQSGMSFKEIAQIQNCPLNTALSRMRYTIIFLRKELSDTL